MKPLDIVLLRRMLKTSIPKNEEVRGESGSPCHRPLELGKKPVGTPLTIIENLAVEIHC